MTNQYRLLRRSVIAGVVTASLAVASLGVLAVSYERAYAGRFLPGVSILGVSLAGLTYAEAGERVREESDRVLHQTMTVHFPDGTSETLTPAGLGMTLDADGLLEDGFEAGRLGSMLDRWTDLATLLASRAVSATGPTFDLDQLMERIEPLLKDHERLPTDASLAISDGQLIISPEEAGWVIDRPHLRGRLEPFLRQLSLPSEITLTATARHAAVRVEDLQDKLTDAELRTDQPLLLEAGETRLELAPAKLVTWLAIDGSSANHPLVWHKETVEAYVEGLAKKLNQPMVPRKLNDRTKQPITEGRAGRKLETTAAFDLIWAGLAARPVLTQQVLSLPMSDLPIQEVEVPPPSNPGLYPGKYLEINLSEQTLYQWEGSNLVARYLVSTGKWDMPTPQGTLYVKNHIAYAYSKKYNLFMPFWLGLARNQDGSGYEGYGIHDLPEWRNGRKEGESHLGRPVSHGCIRLGTGPAQLIYEWADEGSPVYIHT